MPLLYHWKLYQKAVVSKMEAIQINCILCKIDSKYTCQNLIVTPQIFMICLF